MAKVPNKEEPPAGSKRGANAVKVAGKKRKASGKASSSASSATPAPSTDDLGLGRVLGDDIRKNPVDWLDERSANRFANTPVYERGFCR